MIFSKQARHLAMLSMLAIAATSVYTPQAIAKPKSPAQSSCESRGYVWQAGKGCADKACKDPILGNGIPGDNHQVTQPGGKKVTVMCDGFTGKWTVVLTRTPAGPAAPLPLGGAQGR